MRRLRVLLGLLVLSLMMVMPAMAADYDLVINNGRVMDPETMFDDVANVGITSSHSRARNPSTPPGMW